MLKKSSITYEISGGNLITVQEGLGFKHVSVHGYSEPCSGILKHWGKPEDLIEELEQVIEDLKLI